MGIPVILCEVTGINPLFGLSLPLPFDRVRPEHVGEAIETLIQQAREQLDAIAAAADAPTYANTMGALDEASESLDRAVSVVRHLEGVVTTPELREAWNAAQPGVAAFYSSIPLQEGLWRALKAFGESEEGKGLTGVRRRFLVKTLESFERHGAALPPEEKKRLEALSVELATITTKFAQNVLDATAAWELVIDDEARLAGLPESAREAAKQSAEAKGVAGWRFTLQGPSYTAVMTYLDDAGVREQVYRAYMARAAKENAELLPRILELRREKARMLGFATFADFVLADRMAKTGAAARAFVDDLTEKTAPFFIRENEALADFRRAQGDDGPMQAWDIGYWAEKQRQAEFDFNEEDLRPFLPLERVVGGLFDLVERLFEVKVVEAPGVPVWHEEVKHYELRDADGILLGMFYTDWHPRESKRGGAWMDAFITGLPGTEPSVGLMCGNLTPPVAGKPSLLTHREAETIFHEFGHLLHHLLSRVEIKSLAGTSVAWDFVELPSQIMENWCWERESLDLFARHWQTGEPIPEALFQKMKKARTFRGANAQMRQLGFGAVDLALHVDYDAARDGDLVDYTRAIIGRYAPAPLPENYAMICGFTHLFSDATGYAAGYYSYKWAEVLDADAFTRFQKEGLFSPEAGRAFRDEILAKGNSDEPAELFRRFLGRDPDPSALLRRLGLAA
jgi:oligopeptidase A